METQTTASTQNNASSTGTSTFGSWISTLLLAAFLLWVWDGFWTTNIQFLNTFQAKYFPEKHLRENLRSQTQAKNLAVMQEAASHKEIIEQKQRNIETACRYIESSRMLLTNLQGAITPDQLALNARCTSKECQALLSPEADKNTSFCNVQ